MIHIRKISKRNRAAPVHFVFPGPGTINNSPITAKAPNKATSGEKNRDIIQINDFQVHDLRRTVINHMLGDVLIIDDAHVSHKRKSTTLQVYDQNKYNPRKRAALER